MYLCCLHLYVWWGKCVYVCALKTSARLRSMTPFPGPLEPEEVGQFLLQD